MKKVNRKLIIRIIGIAFLVYIGCLLVSFIISRNADPGANLYRDTISFEEGVYRYDPYVILSKIEKGEDDIFFETEPDNDLYLPESGEVNNFFSDDELFEIARAFFEIKWNDDFEDWRLVEISYTLYDCKEGFEGPYSVDYYFQKKIRENFTTNINERNVGFAVWKDIIGWSDKLVDNNHLRQMIIFDDINVHAIDAFAIAEENADSETRLRIENNCAYVLVYMYNNDGWSVNYNDQEGWDLLDMNIDSYSGEIKN